MKTLLIAALLVGSGVCNSRAQTQITNTNIDMAAYLKISQEAASHRADRRLSEADFIRLSNDPNTVVLDARSRAMFDLLHVKGAVNLSFPDITEESLAKLLPDKRQRILIYCNNNFLNEPLAFAYKQPFASLNLSTYISLYSYGYTNVYELGPLLDMNTTKIEFIRQAATPSVPVEDKKKTGAP